MEAARIRSQVQTRPRVGIVVQQYGEPRFGGAAVLAASIARDLRSTADVEVLTTCARDYMTWQNVYAPGDSQIDGTAVRRFPVDRPRDVRAFDRLSRRLLGARRPPIELQERWMRAQGPTSDAMLAHLRLQHHSYDAFFFFSYLYAHSYFGLPLVADRAFLFPLAHDEWPIRFSMWDTFFTKPRGLVYVSPEERDFVALRFPTHDLSGPIVRIPIEAPADADAASFRRTFDISEPFVLYLGRIDRSKGCAQLIADFKRYRAQGRYKLLVLAGEQNMPLRKEPGIRWIGPVDEPTKWDAYAAASVVVMPSAYESLSLTVLEAWASGTPVLVNAHTAPLVGQCRRSGGGLWYADASEFGAALDLLDPGLAVTLGERGRRSVSASQSSATLAPLRERIGQLFSARSS